MNHLAFLSIAYMIAGLSKAKRRACGAVLVRKINGIPVIVSSGVNGTAPGTDNACETEDLTMSYPHVIHAEVNCINKVVVEQGDILYCTDSPCEFCLKALEEAGVGGVYFARGYRLTDHLDGTEIKLNYLPIADVEQYMNHSAERIHRVIV